MAELNQERKMHCCLTQVVCPSVQIGVPSRWEAGACSGYHPGGHPGYYFGVQTEFDCSIELEAGLGLH